MVSTVHHAQIDRKPTSRCKSVNGEERHSAQVGWRSLAASRRAVFVVAVFQTGLDEAAASN